MEEYNTKQILEILNKNHNLDDFIIENTIVTDPFIYKGKEIKKLCFENVVFSESIDLRGMHADEICFTSCVFKNKFFLSDAVIFSRANFDDSIFHSEAFFIRTQFGKEEISSTHQVWFSRAQFSKNVHFNGAQFYLHAHFNEAYFNRTIDFSETQFRKEAMFIETTFADRVIFWEAVFNDKAFFIKTEFKHSANFNLVNFNGATSFVETHLARVDFRVNFIKSLNLSHTTISNTQMTRENIQVEIEQEKNGDFASAREIYIMLKNNFNSIGRYDDQSWAFLKEKEMERENYKKNKQYGKYLLSLSISYLYGYGEKPLYTIRSSFSLTLIFAFIYWCSGKIIPNMDSSFYTLPYKLTFSDSFYFSVITFTTVGYGDWYPDPTHWIRYVVMLEAFVGIFMVGLFVFSITRRTANR
ncbi:potassium channel family protein [Candidatus Poribacteria bacterium]|nr:potassium channel family protein [Candidatus Poribacteria bacterium]